MQLRARRRLGSTSSAPSAIGWRCRPVIVASMERTDKRGYEAMRLNYALLREAINPGDVVGLCFERHIVSQHQMQEVNAIREARGSIAVCEKLLDELMGNGSEEVFQTFMEILESKRNSKDLAGRLRGTCNTHRVILCIPRRIARIIY